MSYGHGPELGAGDADLGVVRDGRRGRATRRAAIERQIDPDGTLPAEEVARLVDERLSAISRQAAVTNRARKAAAGRLVDPGCGDADSPTAAERLVTCHEHPPESAAEPEPAVSVSARRLEVAEVTPGLLARPDVRATLGAHDIGALYQLLQDAGISQRQIGLRTGQSQSDVNQILKGRQVAVYEVLVRIATGLGIPPERMGLSWWGPDGVWYGREVPTLGESGSPGVPVVEADEMLRRHVLAWGGIVMTGAPVEGLGELLDSLPEVSPAAAARQLSAAHVGQVRQLCLQLLDGVRTVGSHPGATAAAVAELEQLLDIPGPAPVRRALMTALGEAHLHAGWSAFDAGLYNRAMYHYSRGLELAKGADDAYCQAMALNRAGLATIETGHPNDGLKMLQAGQIKAWSIPADLGRPVTIGEGSRDAVIARSRGDAATALAMMGQVDAADREANAARELWTPEGPSGCLYYVGARLELRRGRLNVAEPLAAASVRRWEGVSERARTNSSVVLATIHVRAGEPRGLAMAKSSIDTVAPLPSARARGLLLPLAEALEARPGSDAAELARQARRVAA